MNQERDKLLDDLKEMKFNKAKYKLERIDPKGRLVYFRNVQSVGKWMTRFDLNSLGRA